VTALLPTGTEKLKNVSSGETISPGRASSGDTNRRRNPPEEHARFTIPLKAHSFVVLRY
jgi:hypothetical protein